MICILLELALMPTPEDKIAAIAPYMNPEYWSGHVPGQVAGIPLVPVVEVEGSMRRAARADLREYVRGTHTYMPREIYRSGQVFDAYEHRMGSVILASFEKIEAPSESSFFAMLPEPLPPAPTLPDAVSYNDFLTASETSIRVGEFFQPGTIAYSRQMRIGIILAHKSGDRVIPTARDQSCTVSSRTWVPPIFEIGKLYNSGGSRPSLWRVNALDICAEGGTQASTPEGLLAKLLGSMGRGGVVRPAGA